MRHTLAMLSLTLVGCSGSDDYAASEARIAKAVEGKQAGFSKDYYLAKLGIDGTWHKVALIYGYGDDLEACLELAELYTKRYEAAKYTCLPAN